MAASSLIAILVNICTIVGGSALGLLLRKGVRKEITDFIMIAMGIYVVYLGITSMSMDTNAVVMVLSVSVGAALGAAIDLDGKLDRLAKKVEKKLIKGEGESTFSEGLVSFFIVTCVGGFVIVACCNCGMGDPSMVYTMAVMDVFTAMAMASALGIGVMVSAVPVILYRGSLILLAGVLAPLMSDVMLDAFTCIGGLICLPIGLNMMGVTHFKTANFIPMLLVVPLFVWLWGFF